VKTKLITLLSVIALYINPMPGMGQSTDVINAGYINPALTSQTNSTLVSAIMPPAMGMTTGYALFSTNGSVSNSGITYVTGDIGTNVGLTSGFDPLKVTGFIHPLPDNATSMCAGSLLMLYNSLNLLTPNVELLHPDQFGHSMVLTAQTYHLNAATMLTDTLYFNALNDPNAVFCVQINGALTTVAKSNIILMNGAQSKNIFWKIEGAITMNDSTRFKGMVVVNNGAIVLKSGVILDGAAFSTTGSISIAGSTIHSPYSSVSTGIEPVILNPEVELTVAPNPFGSFTTINLKNDSKYLNCNFSIYNTVGVMVLTSIVSKQLITLDTSRLSPGIYFYKLSDHNTIIQSGKLISQN